MVRGNDVRVLLVEDDMTTRRAMWRVLTPCRGADAETIASVLELLAPGDFDIVVARWGQRVRWGLERPNFHAIDVVHAMRRAGDSTPIVVYDVIGRSQDEIASVLNAGADDFIGAPETKPVELAARLRAIARRHPRAAKRFAVGRIMIDAVRRDVLVDDDLIRLTHGEYRLLLYLAQRPNVCVRRDELYLAVFETMNRDGRSNALAAAISRLRRKLGAAAQQLVAIPGVGYRLDGRSSGVRLAVS